MHPRIRRPYIDPCQRAKARVKEILAEHRPAVSEADGRAVDAIVARYATVGAP
jgi:hypothetical protein